MGVTSTAKRKHRHRKIQISLQIILCTEPRSGMILIVAIIAFGGLAINAETWPTNPPAYEYDYATAATIKVDPEQQCRWVIENHERELEELADCRNLLNLPLRMKQPAKNNNGFNAKMMKKQIAELRAELRKEMQAEVAELRKAMMAK